MMRNRLDLVVPALLFAVGIQCGSQAVHASAGRQQQSAVTLRMEVACESNMLHLVVTPAGTDDAYRRFQLSIRNRSTVPCYLSAWPSLKFYHGAVILHSELWHRRGILEPSSAEGPPRIVLRPGQRARAEFSALRCGSSVRSVVTSVALTFGRTKLQNFSPHLRSIGLCPRDVHPGHLGIAVGDLRLV